MYTEDYERRGFSIRNLLIKIIIIVLIILLLLWLVPKFISPKTTSKNTNTNNQVTCTNGKCDNKVAVTSESDTYKKNQLKLKDAALSYFKEEDNLPKEEGESITLTLKELIDKELITDLVDKNKKSSDPEKTYVKMTKLSNGYLLKVNLKDSEKEDYTLIHLDNYSYCGSNDTICSKQGIETPVDGKSSSSYIPIKGTIKKGVYHVPSKVNLVIPSTEGTLKCVYKNGQYYDKNGKVVSKIDYIKQCVAIEQKHSCVKYDGKYYNKDGKVVSKSEYEKTCNSSKDKDSKKDKDTKDEKHVCEKYDGKYYNKDGKAVSKSEYEKSCKTEEDYLYEYEKSGFELSGWSSWSDWTKTSCSTQEINCDNDDSNCLKKLQMLRRKEEVGTQDKTYSKSRVAIRQVDSYREKVCSNYNYVEVNNQLYMTTSSYTAINSVTSSTRSSIGGWVYNGRSSYTSPPIDNATTRYVFAGADFSSCGSTCQSMPNYYYDSYTFRGLTSTSSTSCSNGYLEYKTIPVYKSVNATEKSTRTEPLYADVCYQSTKTRSKNKSSSTEKKWSSYDDSSLLDNGWSYTGNKKLK